MLRSREGVVENADALGAAMVIALSDSKILRYDGDEMNNLISVSVNVQLIQYCCWTM